MLRKPKNKWYKIKLLILSVDFGRKLIKDTHEVFLERLQKMCQNIFSPN